jgi:hypothetical protein
MLLQYTMRNVFCSFPRRCRTAIMTALVAFALAAADAGAGERVLVFVLSGQSNAGPRGSEAEIADTAGKPTDFAHLVTTPDAEWSARGGGIFIRRTTAGRAQWVGYHPHGDPAKPGAAKDGGVPLGIDAALLWRLSEVLAPTKIALIHTYSNATSIAPCRDRSFRTFWPDADRQYKSLLVEPIRAGLADLRAAGHEPELAGLFWMQGERDGQGVGSSSGALPVQPEAADAYEKNLAYFIERLRADTHQPRLPMVLGQIASKGKIDLEEKIRAAQQSVADADRHVTLVDTRPLPRSDGIHLTGVGQCILGTQMADAYLVLVQTQEK